MSADFEALSDRIKHHTIYREQFNNAMIVQTVIAEPKKAPTIVNARLARGKAGKSGGVAAEKEGGAAVVLDACDLELPNLPADSQDCAHLIRPSINSNTERDVADASEEEQRTKLVLGSHATGAL